MERRSVVRFTRNFDYSNGKTRTIYLLLTLLWVAVIFSFSLQPAATSSQVSRGVGHWIVDTFVLFLSERLEAMPVGQLEMLHTLLRKAGLYIPSMLIHLHGQAVPVSRRMRTTLTETVPF